MPTNEPKDVCAPGVQLLEYRAQVAPRRFVGEGWTEESPCPCEFCELHGTEGCEPDW